MSRFENQLLNVMHVSEGRNRVHVKLYKPVHIWLVQMSACVLRDTKKVIQVLNVTAGFRIQNRNPDLGLPRMIYMVERRPEQRVCHARSAVTCFHERLNEAHKTIHAMEAFDPRRLALNPIILAPTPISLRFLRPLSFSLFE
jgi:hypothetical protein